jgi:general secretion pathway protein G
MNKTRHPRYRPTAGFTLVELMVVIAIIAILATIVGYNVLSAVDDSNVAAAQAQIKQFENALVAYKIKFKRFPNSLDELARPPSGEPLMQSIPADPWGNPYQYSVEGNKYRIVSFGADGRPGGTGYDADISSDAMAGDKTR